LRDIARAGYANAASMNRKAREAAVTVFLSDQCFTLATTAKLDSCGATLQRNAL
jgi:hypothetical protein